MVKRQASPTLLLTLLAFAVFIAFTSFLMFGPLLVELAREFHTSVAVVGQLAAAATVTWAIVALLAGPLSDRYGRRPFLLAGLMLVGLGMLGSALSWSYGSLLAFRLLTGVGLAMIPPNCFATVADVFPPEGRGKAIGWLVSAGGISAALGVAAVAFLLDTGGWRLPFYTVGALALVLWIMLWVWLPRDQRQPGRPLAFLSHYLNVGSSAMFWYVLAANSLFQMAFIGVFGYLAAHLIQTYGMTAGETVLPLALAGAGVIARGFIGGRVADHRRRLVLFAIASLTGGLLAALVFIVPVSPWATVALAFGAGSLASVTQAVTPTLLMELAGGTRATATGLFAVSNQLGYFGGMSLGGLMLTLGGFPMVGFFCLGVSVVGVAVLMLKVRDSAEALERIALSKAKQAAV